jgi:hypothetical protein
MPISVIATPPTAATAVVQAATNLQNQNAAIMGQVVRDFNTAFAWIWNNGGAAPNDVFAQFGTNAKKELDTIQARLDFVSALAVANGQALTDYITSDQSTPPVSYTVHMDGTVTVP